METTTLVNLIVSVRDFMKDLLKEDLYPYREPGELTQSTVSMRPMNFFLQTMPVVEDLEYQVPFMLIQLIAGSDEWSESKAKGTSTVTVRIVIELYDPDYEEGKLRLIQLIDRIRRGLRTAGTVGGVFQITDPYEYLIYPDETDCYHVAEISSNWLIPYIQRDISDLLGDRPIVNNFLHIDRHPEPKEEKEHGKKESRVYGSRGD